MRKVLVSLVSVLVMMTSSVFAESTVDVTLEWSDFTTEYVNFTSYSSASKELAAELVKKDTVIFVATEGLERSVILKTIFEKLKDQNPELNATELEIAQGILSGKINVII